MTALNPLSSSATLKLKNSISEQVPNRRWANRSSDCRYYHYHSLTHFCAGKQLCEFKGASTQHISKLDIPVQKKHCSHISWVFYTSLSHQTVPVRRGESWGLFNDAEHVSPSTCLCHRQLWPRWHQSYDAKTTRHNYWSDPVNRDGVSDLKSVSKVSALSTFKITVVFCFFSHVKQGHCAPKTTYVTFAFVFLYL